MFATVVSSAASLDRAMRTHTMIERRQAEDGQEKLNEAFPHLQDPNKVTVTVNSERFPFKQVFHMQWPLWPDHPSLVFLIYQSS